jgi:hypothetical protein
MGMAGSANSEPRAFWRTYWSEIAAVLAAKTLALALLYFLFFSTPTPAVDVGGHLLAKAVWP